MIYRLATVLMLVACNSYPQAFSFRDPAWVGLISKPASGNSNDPVFNSAVHLWHLESTGTRPDSIGGISLLETGGQVNSAAGIHGNAADFQPVSQAGHYLTMASAVGTVQSVAIWVKFRNLPASSFSVRLISSPPDNTGFVDLDSGGNIRYEDDTLENGGNVVNSSLGALNAWHLIVVGTDTVTQFISVDGATKTTSASNGADFSGYTIGYGGPIDAANFYTLVPDALFDEPVIFSSALTQGNVTTLWNSGAGIFYSP